MKCLFFSVQQQAISQSDCDMEQKVGCIWHPEMTNSEAPKHFPKLNLHQKRGHGHCLVVCHPSNPLWAKSLHLRSMLSKSVRSTESYSTSSWHWSTKRVQFFSTTSSSILTTSYRENASKTSRRQKILSKTSLNPKAQIFMLQK